MKRIIIILLCIAAAVLSASCARGGAGNMPDGGIPIDPDKTAVFETVCSAEEALMLSRKTDTVVLEENGCTSGKAVWDRFMETVRNGSPASVLLAHYYVLDRERVSEELYEAEKDQYPKLFFYLVSFDGKEYSVKTRESTEKEPDDQAHFAYLLHFTGKMPSTALYASYDKYVLADDPAVTWEEIEKSLISSQSDAWIRHCTVYTDYPDRKGD